MTAQGGVESAVEAMKLGAEDYLVKPFDPFQLPLIFRRCRERRDARRLREYENRQSAEAADDFFFGRGLEKIRTQLERILEMDRRVAGPPSPILVVGETGVGKSTLARRIHFQGPRAKRSFVELNCATLTPTLIESELYGHERGAFTDARETRIGLFEAADGGTLFLDEVSSLPLSAQAKLLTAIEEGVIRRVGGNENIEVNVRLITASLDNLEEKVAARGFRADLFHRLNVLTIDIPPLRERTADIGPLAEHLLVRLKARYRMPDVRISERGLGKLKDFPWPGNVRELRHELERQLIMTDSGVLEFQNLNAPSAIAPADDWLNAGWEFPDRGFSIEDAILRLIRLALDQTGDNVSAAARLLGVNRDYIRYRLDRK
jgi:DNA-binding NtrC family response regulator